MHFNNRHIILKTTLLLIVVLLCLPCSAKREIKIALDIPVMEIPSDSKEKEALLECPTLIVNQQVESSQDLGSLGAVVFPNLSIQTNQVVGISKLHTYSLIDLNISLTIPIYIINEQYRI